MTPFPQKWKSILALLLHFYESMYLKNMLFGQSAPCDVTKDNGRYVANENGNSVAVVSALVQTCPNCNKASVLAVGWKHRAKYAVCWESIEFFFSFWIVWGCFSWAHNKRKCVSEICLKREPSTLRSSAWVKPRVGEEAWPVGSLVSSFAPKWVPAAQHSASK